MSSAIRDGISVVDDVVVGMGAIVIRSIKRSGTYFGNPARRVSGKT
jgi:acetyltransferase-like isoleucine patch superfamily enzyme